MTDYGEIRRLAEAAQSKSEWRPSISFEAAAHCREDGDYVEAIILFDDNDYAAEVYGHSFYEVDGLALAQYWAAVPFGDTGNVRRD